MRKLLLPLLGLGIGVFLGMFYPIRIPAVYSKYVAMAAVAAMDTIFGGIRAAFSDEFDVSIFLSGFVLNTAVAGGMAYMGDQLGVELYLAAIVAFGVRIFQNISALRIMAVRNRKSKKAKEHENDARI